MKTMIVGHANSTTFDSDGEFLVQDSRQIAQARRPYCDLAELQEAITEASAGFADPQVVLVNNTHGGDKALINVFQIRPAADHEIKRYKQIHG